MKVLNEKLLEEICQYIKTYQVRQGRSPSYRNIAGHFNLSSLSLVSRYVDVLTDRGMIEKDEKNPTVHCLSKICKGLNISIGEFFEEDSRVENPVVNKVVMGLNKLDESEQFQVLDYVRRLVNNKDR